MTETEYICPVDGCGYTGEFSSVRGHITGTGDAEHTWSDLAGLVEPVDGADASPPESDPPEDPEGGGTPPDEGGERGDESDPHQGAKGGEEGGPKEDPTDPDEGADTMDTKDAIALQRGSTESTAEIEEESTPESDLQEKSGGSGIPLPVSSTTIMFGAATVLIFALLYAYVRSGSPRRDDVTETGDEQDDAGDDSVSNEEVTLID